LVACPSFEYGESPSGAQVGACRLQAITDLSRDAQLR
jgi:hypothetical protein